MSRDLEARIRALERKQQNPEWWANLKPTVPLVDMGENWQEQYYKNPELISKIWQDTVKDYHDKHIVEWQKENGKTIPPWYRLVPHDDSEWFITCKKNAKARLAVTQALSGNNKTNNNNEVDNGN